jgi:hypothetical protein
MSDEGETKLAVSNQPGPMDLTRARSDCRVADQTRELSGPTTEGRTLKSAFQHQWRNCFLPSKLRTLTVARTQKRDANDRAITF